MRYLGTGYQVTGELYDVNSDQLAHLDRLEGHPKVYTRGNVNLKNSQNDKISAECYFMKNHHEKFEKFQYFDSYDQEKCEKYVPKKERYPGKDDKFIDEMMTKQWKKVD